MDFLTLAKQRYSVRDFTREPVSAENLKKIIEAGYVAPTAANLQPQRILVIDTPEGLEKLKLCTRCKFEPTAVLLVCWDKNASWKRKYDGADSGAVDAAIVTTHMMLGAAALGVGSTWVMHFNPEKTREQFCVPAQYEPVAFLMMGCPAENAKPNPLHGTFAPKEELVFYNSFQ